MRSNLKVTAQLAYIITDADCDYGSLFYHFYIVSVMWPILVYSMMGLYSHSYDVCIKAFMYINGEEFCQMSNK